MRRLTLLLAAVLPLAACGGGGTATKQPATGTQPSVATPLVAHFKGVLKGTAKLTRQGSARTAVTLDLGTGTGSRTVSIELDRGSCGAPKGLRLAKPLGTVRNSEQSWSVTASPSSLTASPLAVVIRGASHGVVSCAQVPVR